MVLVDTGSTDRSAEIVQAHGLEHHVFSWTGHFSEARNYSLSLAQRDWILVLDMDERMLPSDVALLRERMSESGRDAFSLRQVTFTDTVEDLGWRGIETLPPAFHAVARGYVVSPLIRAFRNFAGIHFHGAIHELVGESIARQNLSSMVTDIPVYHYGWVASARTDEEKLLKRRAYARMIRKAWEEDPSPKMAYYYVSTLEDPEEKLRILYRLTRQYPEVRQFWEAMTQSAVGLQQYDRALAYAERGLSLHPESFPLLVLKARLLNETGHPCQAAELLAVLLRRDPQNPLLLREEARSRLLMERTGPPEGTDPV